SWMGLEALAALGAVHGMFVLYPCDANQAAALVAAMADFPGIVYLRTARGESPVIYLPGESFPIGGCRVVRSSAADHVTLVGAGVTLHEALAAADLLAADGITARVIDLYSVKPVDAGALRDAAGATQGFVTVEDHWPEGGLGDAVLDVFAHGQPAPAIIKLAVHGMPGSATPSEQLSAAGIDRNTIANAARKLVGSSSGPGST